ncbi:MAG: hypothetical protein HY721_11440 [Planctomycetes bacterium]|nr:hypothetical protein [Planctomycetota bacterium]
MSDALSKLRQQLRQKLAELDRLLLPAFDSAPILPGTVHVSKHRCGKPHCHCASGRELHEALRLQIRFQDGTANRCLSAEAGAFWRPRTEAYRRLRKAGRAFRKWEKEVRGLLEAIERARQSMEGLSDEDRKRPLR